MFPYFNSTINEQIRNQAEHDLVESILKMNYDQIVQHNSEINTAVALDRNYDGSREHTLNCKSGIVRINQLKRMGKFEPSLGIFGTLAAITVGWLAGTELVDRLYGD